jgi:hypothetical protein
MFKYFLCQTRVSSRPRLKLVLKNAHPNLTSNQTETKFNYHHDLSHMSTKEHLYLFFCLSLPAFNDSIKLVETTFKMLLFYGPEK